ncbi:MAG TPA: ATPase domain-containing protein [Pirellulaceae bacterium]|jgi:KaiC/GvpD/RAD55 family RecA-like ATPase
MSRHSTGVPALDDLLGGGLIPGTLTVVVGATGIGKTQLGLQFANLGETQEQHRGIIFDCASRGDSQSHAEYARRMFDWRLSPMSAEKQVDVDGFFGAEYGDYLHIFDYHGRRVTRQDLDWDAWRDWQAELNSRLRAAIAFFYGNFVRGVRRVVIDGIEPADRPGESIQFNLFEYIYHQILRKDPEWVARDLFREAYRRHADEASAHLYNSADIGCLLLYTSRESMLDELISRPLDEGDVLSNANTLIYMGKIREGNRIGRGLYIAKHRGSACDERILEYKIGERGISLLP